MHSRKQECVQKAEGVSQPGSMLSDGMSISWSICTEEQVDEAVL